MPTLPAFLRSLLLALVCALTTLPAWAQELPAPKITGDDIRRALIWTGHFSAMSQGDAAAIYHSAIQSWQTSKGYKATDHLADEQVSELLAEGDKQRESFGWAKLEDKSIGFSIGVPTKLVKFLSTRNDNANFWYDFEGSIHYTVGSPLRRHALRQHRSAVCACHAQLPTDLQGEVCRRLCRRRRRQWSGWIPARGVPNLRRGRGGRRHRQKRVRQARASLMSAMADSLSVSRHFNPTAIPRPKLDQPTPTAGRHRVRRRDQSAGHRQAHSQYRRRRQDRRHQARSTRRPFPHGRAGVRQGVACGLRGDGRRADGLGGGNQRARAADQLPRRQGSGARDADARQGQATGRRDLGQRASRPLCPQDREEAGEMGGDSRLRRHQGRRAGAHGRHAAGTGTDGGRRSGLVQAHPRGAPPDPDHGADLARALRAADCSMRRAICSASRPST